ncbi:unnamed protein product [Zymoseptoria tritici ST99CH_3D1]|nr:unnamed protein product [Zymoseptoria tritici ST99CH_3D1]
MSNTTQNNHPTPNPTQPTIFTAKAAECSASSLSCRRAARALLRPAISAAENNLIGPSELRHARVHAAVLIRTGQVLDAMSKVLQKEGSDPLKLNLVRVDVSGSASWTFEQAREFVKVLRAADEVLDQGPSVRIDGEEEEVAGQITFDLVLRGARPGSNGP